MHVVLELDSTFLTELLPMLIKLCQPWFCLHNYSYIFHWIDLKFCRLVFLWYEDMHVVLEFWFDYFWVIAHADLNFANHDLVNGFYIIQNYVDFRPMAWRCACGLGFLIELFSRSYCPCWHMLCRSEILSPQLLLHRLSDSFEIL